jgi:hypothetical protein
MCAYKNRKYNDVQEESRINVNSFLHGNDDVLTKLNAEKDIAGQKV